MVFGLFETKSKKRSYSKKSRGTKKTKTMKRSNKKTTKRSTKSRKGRKSSKRTMRGGEAVTFKLDSHIGGLPEVVRGTHDCK